MLVDRERLEYDDEDGSSVASDIQRDQLKDFATRAAPEGRRDRRRAGAHRRRQLRTL